MTMKKECGFTLIELMMAAAIGGIILAGLYAMHQSQQKSHARQCQDRFMRENLRGSLHVMEREIRMAGYDPRDSGGFGITDIRLDDMGNGTLEFTLDDNLDSTADQTDANGEKDGRETNKYSLYDYPTSAPDGELDLARKHGARRQLLAQAVEALGFAFAFDSNNDGNNLLDRDQNGNLLWAIDMNGDNLLDHNLDTDNDGDIDLDDDPEGTPLSNPENGSLLDVPLSDIRAVRVWLLAKGDKADPDIFHIPTYVISHLRVSPKDCFPRRVLTATVWYRNMGVHPNN